ncbi:hypothetical protein OG205_07005 [Lentzea sp. NBC_00516]|uniref:hypothetical protein n=1 Tax=Lentzea sp. NBC_00516 TaxID=2903582 RepID=UPI002E821DB4|nr:hypothetical protein [Lentzea sp. NBC_00516]WUD26736.1 hypothetical protein OG205_07005 [Lentzea sp. NBC_00516]
MALADVLRALIGPVTGAILGTLVLGGFITWLNHTIQTRRANRELRSELVNQVTDAAGSFHFLATYYWFMKDTTASATGNRGYLETVKHDLGQQYRRSRVVGKALESRLQTYFPKAGLHADWHAMMDICSVLYFRLVDSPAERLERIYRQDAMTETDRHSGFSVEELRTKPTDDLLDALWNGLTALARQLLVAKIART